MAHATRPDEGRAFPVTLSPCHLVTLSLLLAAGCDLPGKPRKADRPEPANEVVNFDVLFSTHCAGCHGADGKVGPAPPLNDPIFLAIVPDTELRSVIRDGRSVTAEQRSLMPAFAHKKGGPLTDAQIDALAGGIKEHWGPPASGSFPAYLLPTGGKGGNKDERERLFARACAECHGADGHGEKDGRPTDGGALNDPAFLALISDQALRRIIITGRPDLGMPPYDGKRGRPADFHALSSAQIDDLVALLKFWRQGSPGNGK
jgi:mono/diheme cytochrome c family protein